MLRRLIHIFPLLVLILSSVLAFWQPQIASAASSGGFEYTDTTYKTIVGPTPAALDSVDGYDGTANYKLQSDNQSYELSGYSGCHGTITADHPGVGSGTLTGACGSRSGGGGVDNLAITIAQPGGTGNGGTYQGVWVDHNIVQVYVNGALLTFLDEKTDGSVTMHIQNPPDDCAKDDYIDGFKNSGSNKDDNQLRVVHLHLSVSTSAQGESDACSDLVAHDLQMTDPNGMFGAYFAWQDSSTISTSDQSGMIFCNSKGNDDKCGSDKKTFLAAGGSDEKDTRCQSELDVDPAVSLTSGTLIYRYNDNTDQLKDGYPDSLHPKLHQDANNCWVSDPIHNVLIANPQDVNGTYASDLAAGTSATAQKLGSGSNNQTLGCDYKFTDPLTWILCPVIQLFTRFAAAGDYIITQQLEVNSNKIFCDASSSNKDEKICGAYYSAWTSFRNIALGLMVIGGLVMLIAQGLGMEILDAYTLRKVLPRILIVAIGITLSWPLMQAAVNVANDLGIGIRALIYQPFANLHNTISLSLNGNNGFDFIFGGVGAVAGTIGFAAWLYFGGLGILISLAGTAALAVLVAILVLVLRQVAITMMIIVAPVAIVMFILPNTQKVYKIWWESFSKALLMFPLIAGMIASGRVFSAVANSQAHDAGNSLSGLFYGFAAFIAYFAPYFLIPATFKLAGGAIRQIGGFVNDRSRGIFDRRRNKRAEMSKKMREEVGHKFKTGDFNNPLEGLKGSKYKGLRGIGRATGGLTGAANVVGKNVGVGARNYYGRGAKGREAKAIVAQQAAAAAANEDGMKAFANKNAAMRMAIWGHHFGEEEGKRRLVQWYMNGGDDGDTNLSEEKATEKADDAIAKVRAIGGYNAGRAAAAFLNMGKDGTAIRDVDDMMELASIVGEGDGDNTYLFAAQVASASRGVGRSGLAIATKELGEAVDARVRLDHATGADKADAQAEYDKKLVAANLSGAGGETAITKLSTAKARDIKNNVDESIKVLKKHQAEVAAGGPLTISDEQANRAAAVIVDYQAGMDAGYGKVDNREAFVSAMTPENEQVFKNFLGGQAFETAEGVDAAGQPIKTRQVHLVEGERIVGPADAAGNVPREMRPASRKEVVEKIMKRRYAEMSPEQRAEMERQAVKQPNPQDEPPQEGV